MAVSLNERTINQWNSAKTNIVNAFEAIGIDPKLGVQIAGFESGYNPTARPIAVTNPERNKQTQFDGVKAISTAYGYGQFLDSTWKNMLNAHGTKYNIDTSVPLSVSAANEYRTDLTLQAAMLAEFTKENIDIVTKRNISGGNTSADIYAMHNLGSGDGPKFLEKLQRSSKDRVDTLLSADVISGNQSLYGDGSRTFQEAYNGMIKEMNGAEVYVKNMHSSEPLVFPKEHPLLREGSTGDAVVNYQQKLVEAGYLNAVTGTFDEATVKATKALQQEHYLTADGVVGLQAHIAIHAKLTEGTQGLPAIDQSIHTLLAKIDTASSEAFKYVSDPTGIHQQYTTELALLRQDLIDAEEKRATTIESQLSKGYADRAEAAERLNQNVAESYALKALQGMAYEQMNADDQLSVMSDAERSLKAHKSLTFSNASDVRILQDLLRERNFLDADSTGYFGALTQKGLKDALGLSSDHTFGQSITLDAETLAALTTPAPNQMEARLETLLTQKETEREALHETIAALDQSIATLDELPRTGIASQIEAVRQSIEIQQLSKEQYDQTHIEPLQQLQVQLKMPAVDAEGNPLTPYAVIADQLKAYDITLETPAITAFKENNHANGLLNKTSDTEVKAVQQFLYDQGYLNRNQAGETVTAEKAVDGIWGNATTHAVKAYQQAVGIVADGVVGRGFREAMHHDYCQQMSPEMIDQHLTSEINQRIADKPEAMNQINQTMAQLERQLPILQAENQLFLTHQMDVVRAEQRELSAKIEHNQPLLNQWNAIYERLDNERSATDPEERTLNQEASIYSQIKTELPMHAFLTEQEQRLAEKTTLDLTDKADVQLLQSVYHERGQLTEGQVLGNYFSITQGLVAESISLPEGTEAKDLTTLTQAELTQVAEQRVNQMDIDQMLKAAAQERDPMLRLLKESTALTLVLEEAQAQFEQPMTAEAIELNTMPMNSSEPTIDSESTYIPDPDLKLELEQESVSLNALQKSSEMAVTQDANESIDSSESHGIETERTRIKLDPALENILAAAGSGDMEALERMVDELAASEEGQAKWAEMIERAEAREKANELNHSKEEKTPEVDGPSRGMRIS